MKEFLIGLIFFGSLTAHAVNSDILTKYDDRILESKAKLAASQNELNQLKMRINQLESELRSLRKEKRTIESPFNLEYNKTEFNIVDLKTLVEKSNLPNGCSFKSFNEVKSDLSEKAFSFSVKRKDGTIFQAIIFENNLRIDKNEESGLISISQKFWPSNSIFSNSHLNILIDPTNTESILSLELLEAEITSQPLGSVWRNSKNIWKDLRCK